MAGAGVFIGLGSAMYWALKSCTEITSVKSEEATSPPIDARNRRCWTPKHPAPQEPPKEKESDSPKKESAS